MESTRSCDENSVQDYTNWITFERITLRRILIFVFRKRKFWEKKITFIFFLTSQILGLTKVNTTFEI